MRVADLGAFWCALLCCGGARAQGIVVPGPTPAPTVGPVAAPLPGPPPGSPAGPPGTAQPPASGPPPGWVLVPTPQPAPAQAPPPAYAPAPAAYAPTYAPAYAPTYAPPGAAPPASFRPASFDPYLRRPLVVEGHASIGGPYGWVGGAADYSFARMFSLGAGVGLGQSGVQLGGMARFRIAFDAVSVGFGAGGSGGPYEGLFLTSGYRWTAAYWLNTEAFLEVRSKSGLMVRGYVGSGALLNPGDGVCDPQSSRYYDCDNQGNHREPPTQGFLIYMGTAIGYAFSL